jgi:ATP-binding cassette, subfamily B, bacterial
VQGHGGMPLRPLGDPREFKGAVDPEVVRRALRMARPYARRLIAFVLLLVVSAGAAATPPLLVRHVINAAIPTGDLGLLWLLFAGMVGVAVTVAGLSMTERWLSSWIGEQLIFDLRRLAYRHVQSMPLAFFTRTQTGALITRLNNDVVGAQRALTGTLGGIVDNLITVVITLAIMFTIEWRITLIAMALLPGVRDPCTHRGPTAAGALPRVHGAQRRDEQRDDRALPCRRRAAGQALRSRRPPRWSSSRAGRRRSPGSASAPPCTVERCSLRSGFIGAVATALVYLIGGHLVIGGTLDLGGVVARWACTSASSTGRLRSCPTPAWT